MRFVMFASLLLACGGQLNTSDGGTTNDSGVCIDLEPSAFDTSCGGDSDCIGVYGGNLCSGYNCICPTSSISAKSQSAYEAMFSKVTKGTGPVCSCPAFGTPHCIASQCVFCPNPALHPQSYPPGCPDAGP